MLTLREKTGNPLRWSAIVFEAFDGDLVAAEDFLVNGKYEYFCKERFHALHFAVTKYMTQKIKSLEKKLQGYVCIEEESR